MDAEISNSTPNPIENVVTNSKRLRSPETAKMQSKSKRGRPRKRINYCDLDAGSSTPFIEEPELVPVKRNSLKKPKITEEIPQEVSNDTTNRENTNPESKKYTYTGGTVRMLDTLFTLIATNDNLNDSRGEIEPKVKIEIDEEKQFISAVTCAVCKQKMEKNIWSHHKQRYHNNLAWKEGESPLDLTDKAFIMTTLNALYKKKKPLYCQCGIAKKSVVGFLSHQSACQKSDEQMEEVKVACELCGKKILPVSMTTHVKLVHSKPKPEVHENVGKEKDSTLQSGKRTAAKKALSIINQNVSSNEVTHFTSNFSSLDQDFVKGVVEKNMNGLEMFSCRFLCGFTAPDLEEFVKHLNSCEKKPEKAYICKYCLQVQTDKLDIIKHLESVHEIFIEHSNTDSDYDFSEEVNKEERTQSDRINPRIPDFIRKNNSRTSICFEAAKEWTQEFQDENYSDLLYSNLKPTNWTLLPFQVALQYLPKLDESCNVARKMVNTFGTPHSEEYEWTKYKLFESDVHEDAKITFFCGGPVASMAWMPTPQNNNNSKQILAVSVLNSPDDRIETNENYAHSSAVQFWSFGALNNNSRIDEKPKLVLNLCHDHGPVWHMEWCPSGCYNPEGIGRAGLLATSGADSNVYVYSVPFSLLDSGLCYKPKPVFKLMLQRTGSSLFGGVKFQSTKISWSKAAGHRFIAVGYSNGFTAIFDLELDSYLTKYVDMDNITCYLPFKSFQAHTHVITGLVLSPLSGGCRWLLTGSVDRSVHLWDLNHLSYPINTVKKHIVTDIVWPMHWVCYMTSSDEAYSSAFTLNCMLTSIRDHLSDSHVGITCSSSTISSIAFSDWHNCFIHSTAMGEIIAVFPQQLFHLKDTICRSLKSRRMLFGYNRAIELDKTSEERERIENGRIKVLNSLMKKKSQKGLKLSELSSGGGYEIEEPLTYDKVVEKYALLFCDNPMGSDKDFPKSTNVKLSAASKHYGVSKPNQYPINAINKLVISPNRQTSFFYAAGYQAGFVRLTFMKYAHDQNT